MLAGCSTPPAAPLAADHLFEHVNVVPMDRELVLEQRAVAVRDGRIIAVVDQSDAARVNARERINGGGRYMLPGLADMHVHLRTDPQTTFNLFLANGVTTARNVNDTDGGFDHVQLRSDVAI
jgi:predicted amidohydrolase YtcJ